MDHESWLDDFMARMRNVQENAAELTKKLGAASATATSADRTVSVTVSAQGALLDLRLGQRATALPPAKLSAQIMKVAAEARRAASAKVDEALSDFGDDGAIKKQYGLYHSSQSDPRH